MNLPGSNQIWRYTSLNSTWLVVIVTADRLLHVLFPFLTLRHDMLKIAKYETLLLYVLGMVTVVIPEYVGSWMRYNDPNNWFVNFYDNIMYWSIFTVQSTIPVLLTLIMNMILYYKMNRGQTFNDSSITEADIKRRKQQTHVTVMVFTMTVMFVILRMPQAIYFIVHINTPPDLRYGLVEHIMSDLVYLNSAINFILYLASGKDFRQGFRKIFCAEKKSQNTNTVT